MHIIAHAVQIAIAAALNDERLVAAAEQVAEELVPAIEPAGVGPQKPFHARHQIGLGRLDDQMKMIGHQTIRMDLPAGLVTGFGEALKEAQSILVVVEDGFAAVAAVHEVVQRSGVLQSQLSGHDGRVPEWLAESTAKCAIVRD